uniref:Reverse transcriptase domain-containing protein n=2 Tax=Cuerna arida TaxID=1464854 RepID=A0A1B6EIY4_9HEMI
MVCEVTGTKIKISNKIDIHVLGYYRPPNANIETALQVLDDTITEAKTHNSYIIATGDINIDNLTNNRERSALNELLASHDLTRLALPPTRVTATSNSSIDIVCTDLPPSKLNVEVCNTGLSDHTGQYCTVDLPKILDSATFSTYRNTCSRNLNNLKSILATETWENVTQLNNIDNAYDNFLDTFKRALDRACPFKTKRQSHSRKNKIYNEETLNLRKEFINAQDKFNLTGRIEDKSDANQKKKAYDLKLRQLKKEANADYIYQANNKTKAIWELINRERADKNQSMSDLINLTIDGMKETDPKKIADHLNTFFVNIADNTLKQHQISNDSLLYSPRYNIDTTMTEMTPTTAKEVKQIIRSLKSKTSSGLDEMSSKIIKFCEAELLKPILHVTNLSFIQGKFPKNLKQAKIYPKYKQGNKDEATNYRPISLLPTVSKIIEKITLSRLLTHLQDNKLLSNNQHGFRKERSTSTAIMDLVEYITDNLEEGNTITSVFLDLSKAFDCLGHNLILAKLQTLGVKQSALKWFESYLSERYQVVEVKKRRIGDTCTVHSEKLSMTREVPQGFFLGPVLYEVGLISLVKIE